MGSWTDHVVQPPELRGVLYRLTHHGQRRGGGHLDLAARPVNMRRRDGRASSKAESRTGKGVSIRVKMRDTSLPNCSIAHPKTDIDSRVRLSPRSGLVTGGPREDRHACTPRTWRSMVSPAIGSAARMVAAVADALPTCGGPQPAARVSLADRCTGGAVHVLKGSHDSYKTFGKCYLIWVLDGDDLRGRAARTAGRGGGPTSHSTCGASPSRGRDIHLNVLKSYDCMYL